MKLNVLPDGPPSKASEDKTINLVLFEDNTIGYYFGTNVNNMQFTNYSPLGIMKEIQLAQQQIARQFGNPLQLYVVIKPTSSSTYKNVVDVLDEMLINKVSRYILTEVSDYEADRIKKG